jgi:hypothetical protein
MKNYYDVIIVGGGSAGCAAAYTTGRLGLKTLLVEKNIHLGGAITSGLVVPAMNTSKKQINKDFFDALVKELNLLKGQITYLGNPGWFNPELCKIALDRLMQKANVDVIFNTHLTELTIIENDIKGVTLSSSMLSVYIDTKYIIDATGNCEVAALASCNFLQDKEKFQPVSLRFIMSGIDLQKFSKWILDFDKNRDVTTSEIINGEIHLSTAYTWDNDADWALKPLFDDAVEKNILTNDDRNYFQIFTIPNMPTSIAFNCPRMYFAPEIDPLNNVKISKALIKGRESIIRIADFCKKYFPGFEKSYISNIADDLGIRVSRRIKGKYVYTIDDLKSGKQFSTPVLISDYPIDVHSTQDGKSQLEEVKSEYQLPVEALISEDYDNLFVAGRCLSADFYAQAALRIQPSCFSMGEGVAKYIAKLLK